MELGRVGNRFSESENGMTSEKTFSNDELLPPLPLPELNDSLSLYLDSVKPHLTYEEFVKTKEIVDNFEENEGKILHQRLLDRAKERKNWLEEWWSNYAYLSSKEALVPGTNFGGAWLPPDHPLKKLLHGDLEHDRLRARTAATFLHHELRFWRMLRKEAAPPNKDGKGAPFTMHQLRFLFNGARLPGEGPGGMDKVTNYFMTEEEGKCPNHVIILHQGRFFKLIPFDEDDGEPWDINKLETVILQIERVALTKGPNVDNSVGVLTTLDRDEWAKIRKMIITINPDNELKFKEIESAILAIVLDDSEPETEDVLIKNVFKGGNGCSDIYAEKSWSRVATKNGLFASQSEHSAYDGMATMDGCVFALMEISKQKPSITKYLPEPKLEHTDVWFENNKSIVREIEFELNSEIQQNIIHAKNKLSEKMEKLYMELKCFKSYGKNAIKEMKIHPDAFMQIAIQVAGYRTSGKALPTYETATTRHFYHGRTETVRSCTEEAINFAKALDEKEKYEKTDLIGMFHEAIDKHNLLMKKGMENAGCDRHLFGLLAEARENSEFKKLPEIFTDASFAKSGGGGNFKLSTSLCGYTSITGCCPPMILDGYGVFYAILPNKLLVWVTAYQDSQETKPDVLWDNLTNALTEIHELFMSSLHTSKQ